MSLRKIKMGHRRVNHLWANFNHSDMPAWKVSKNKPRNHAGTKAIAGVTADKQTLLTLSVSHERNR